MGGNIGLPILAQDPLPEGGVYVLELSSYQIDLTQSLDCDVAVLLNITPDHLDRYEELRGVRGIEGATVRDAVDVSIIGCPAKAGPRVEKLRVGVDGQDAVCWQSEPGASGIRQPTGPLCKALTTLQNAVAAMCGLPRARLR